MKDEKANSPIAELKRARAELLNGNCFENDGAEVLETLYDCKTLQDKCTENTFIDLCKHALFYVGLIHSSYEDYQIRRVIRIYKRKDGTGGIPVKSYEFINDESSYETFVQILEQSGIKLINM